LLDQLARRMRARGESVLAPFGLRPRHFLALSVLREQHGSSQQALAGSLQMDRTNVVGLLNELEDEGLIERRRAAEDRRRHVVVLTKRGLDRLAKADLALATVEGDVLSGLSAKERQTLYDLLQKANAEHAVDCGAAIADC
jgi:DNA-binding MarR family transcriptional regulator